MNWVKLMAVWVRHTWKEGGREVGSDGTSFRLQAALGRLWQDSRELLNSCPFEKSCPGQKRPSSRTPSPSGHLLRVWRERNLFVSCVADLKLRRLGLPTGFAAGSPSNAFPRPPHGEQLCWWHNEDSIHQQGLEKSSFCAKEIQSRQCGAGCHGTALVRDSGSFSLRALRLRPVHSACWLSMGPQHPGVASLSCQAKRRSRDQGGFMSSPCGLSETVRGTLYVFYGS